MLTTARTVTDTNLAFVPAVGGQAVVAYTNRAYDFAVRVAANVWDHLRRGVSGKDYGAMWDIIGNVNDTVALQAVMNEQTAGSSTRSRKIYLPAGETQVNNTLIAPAQGGSVVSGEGLFSTMIYLMDGFDGPVLTANNAINKQYFRDFGIYCRTKGGHVSKNFPLLDMSGADLGALSGILVGLGPGDGVWHKGNGDQLFWTYGFSISNDGNGIVIQSCQAPSLLGVAMQANGKSGVWIGGYPTLSYFRADLGPLRTESQGVYGIQLDAQTGTTARVHVHDWLSYNEGASAYLDDQTTRCLIESSVVLGMNLGSATTPCAAAIYDMGAFNKIRDVDGLINPFDDEVEYHWPASCVLDPYEARGDATAWLTAGSGGVTKAYDVMNYNKVRFRRWYGKRPVRITPGGSVAVGNYGYKVVNVSPGETYMFHVYWWSGGQGDGCIFRVADDANPGTDLFNSGVITQKGSYISTGDWGEERYMFPFLVPSGVTKLRLILQPQNTLAGQTVYTSRQDVIREGAVVNPAFLTATGSTYTGGIANGWSALSGAGTPTRETTIQKWPGAGSQKLVCTTAPYYLGQTVTLDPYRYYQFQGWAYCPTGLNPANVIIGLGNSDTDFIERMPIFENDKWCGVSCIVKPDLAHTKVIVGLRANGTAYFNLANLRPLRERREQWWRHTSDEIDATGGVSYLFAPTIDENINRIAVTCTRPTSAVVNVGVPGDVARFGTVNLINANAWDQREVTLTRTDLRSVSPGTANSLPLQASIAGGSGTYGSVFVTVEGGSG